MQKPKWLLGLTLIVLLALVACGGEGNANNASNTANDDTASTDDTGDDKPTITLIQNTWPASELNVNVAKILIENELGYPVEIVSLDEGVQWATLAAGDADASLEVWPSGHGDNIQQYIIDQGVVEDGGPLGPLGRIGWFVPNYVLEDHPELATWEGFQNAEIGQMFATAETGELGAFLAGSPGWTQYDDQIIANLGLPFQVIVTGSEEALLAAVAAAYERQEPVLFYFYTPHALFSQYDLTQVELPAYSDDCYATIDAGGVDCAYPDDVLMKIFSTDLDEKAPDVHAFLKNFNYTNEDQIEMLGLLEEGQTVPEAAQAWVDAHSDTWEGWLP